jgi:hypothetical protein
VRPLSGRGVRIVKPEDVASAIKLEDIFAGPLELTATELAYLRCAIEEHYMRGGWCPQGENRIDFARRVGAKLGTLKLDRMVTPDGSRLVSVEEHADIVAAMKPPKETA